jgi:hypothetical protein
VLRFNRFNGVRTRVPTAIGSPFVHAIYLDDQISGFSIYNNSFNDTQVAINLGGGREQYIADNVVAFSDYALRVDDRGLVNPSQEAYCKVGGQFYEQLTSVHYTEPPYATEYPRIVNTYSQVAGLG